MRARVYSNGGNSTGGFTFNGGTMTGALFLAGNPSEPLEAASKQYLDSSLVNLNASNISSGILPSGRLPTFVGDLVKPAGSSTINLAPIGITAGDYIKPTVDAKGRVVSGSSLVEADIPNLSWDKVSLNRPTTLSGYGINNAIPLSGGTLTGFLSFNGSITGNLQAVTKQYIDTTLSSSAGIAIGDIIRKPYSTTPPGFFKCNGAEVDKTTYNSLYATIGDRFSKQKNFTFGQPWSQQYNINEIQYNDINNWIAAGNIPAGISTAQAIVTKNRVYLIGGFIAGSGAVATCYTTQINSDGTLGAWVAGPALPSVCCYGKAVVIKNRVYLIGGSTNGDNSINTVYTTTINSDGILGAWISDSTLPGAISNTNLIVTTTKLYVCGGNNGVNYIATVYVANINSDGTLGAWTTGTSLPEGFYCSSVVLTKNRVYLCGGRNSGTIFSKVYTAVINTDGTLGAWSLASNSLPIAVWTAVSYVTKNRVYLIGGTNSAGSAISSVITAAINADGTLGSWSLGTSIPGTLAQSTLVATKNRLYVLGGYGNSAIYSSVISGGLNDYSTYYSEDTTNYMMPGSGKPWQQQYQINTTQSANITGWTVTTSLPSALGDSAAVVTKNRVYLLGGFNGSSFVAAVYTAAINSDGTLGTWTTGTALPVAIARGNSVITKNRVYLIGGATGGFVATVYTAPINADGTLGAWTTGTALPAALGYSQIVITKNYVYVLGGWNGSATLDTTYYAPINSDGTLGAWLTGTVLPTGLGYSQAVVTKNRVYLIGGSTGNGGVIVSTVYTATINSDGLIGPWSTDVSLPAILSLTQVIVTSNRVYLLGGYNGGAVATVYTASINGDGTLGIWTTGTSLPGGLGFSQAIVTKNHVYLLGGGYNATVYMASILGGENDYSPYYDGTITPMVVVDPSTTFALPDLSQSEKFDSVSYIKY